MKRESSVERQSDLNAALVAMVDAMESVSSTVKFYLNREINSPSNHQEFAREAQEKLDKFNAAKRLPADIVASVERDRQQLQLEALKVINDRYYHVPQAMFEQWLEDRIATLEAELKAPVSIETATGG